MRNHPYYVGISVILIPIFSEMPTINNILDNGDDSLSRLAKISKSHGSMLPKGMGTSNKEFTLRYIYTWCYYHGESYKDAKNY